MSVVHNSGGHWLRIAAARNHQNHARHQNRRNYVNWARNTSVNSSSPTRTLPARPTGSKVKIRASQKAAWLDAVLAVILTTYNARAAAPPRNFSWHVLCASASPALCTPRVVQTQSSELICRAIPDAEARPTYAPVPIFRHSAKVIAE
eukprot:2634411-Pleurochrysis_carterae.AAC.1